MTIGMLLNPYGETSPGGLGRSVFEMARALLALDGENSYTLYFKDRQPAKPEFAASNWTYRGLGSRLLWLTGAFGMDRTLDAYIFFTPIIPLFFTPRKSVVIAFDFAYLDRPQHSIPEWIRARFLYLIHGRSLRQATSIIAISAQTKADIVRHFEITASKIKVVPLGYIALPQEYSEIPTPEEFFLFAGVLKERKNVAGIIRAFALFAKSNSTHELLIAGKRSGAYAESLVRLARELGVEGRVRFLGYVTDAELAHLYRRARALVFPSLIEGFGMPVLEAMHAGLPVITSDQGALAEVAGGAALLVDPARPADIASAMEQIADDAELRAELIQKGLARARQFSWEKTAAEILEIVAQLQHTDPIR